MSIKTHQQLVHDFMLLVEQIPEDHKLDVTKLSSSDVQFAKLRLKLITEELSEMFEAFLSEKAFEGNFVSLFQNIQQIIDTLSKEDFNLDRKEILDAIVDQDYINSGTGVWLDLPLEEGFQAVHENNLTKVDPITGKVIKREDGKILKPASYVSVDLQKVLDEHDGV